MTLQKAITILMENTHLEMIVKSNLLGNNHKVDITEGASAQFPTWIFHFGPHGQLRAVRKSTFEGCFLMFSIFLQGVSFISVLAMVLSEC